MTKAPIIRSTHNQSADSSSWKLVGVSLGNHLMASVKSPFKICAVIIVAFACLISVGLDYAPLWEDEAISALIAKNILAQGVAVVDDGRYVASHGFHYGGDNQGITDEMRLLYPQMTMYLIALGMYIFGINEIGVRSFSVILSVLSMILFFFIVRKEYPDKPWVATVAVLLASFSQMVILYARSGTYNSLAMLLMLLLFRLYQLYCEQAQVRTAIALACISMLGFHTQYLISVAFFFALSIFHLLFRAKLFSRKAWVLSLIFVVPYIFQALRYGYSDIDIFARPSILSNENISLLYYARFILLNFISLNDTGIIYWTVALWMLLWLRKTLPHNKINVERKVYGLSDVASVIRLQELVKLKSFQFFVLIILSTFGIAILSHQPKNAMIIDVRYYSGIAPFGAVVGAELLIWIWARSRAASLAIAAILLFTSLPGWPLAFNRYYRHNWHWTLPAYAIEFNGEYPSALAEVVSYLRDKASQDDLVFVKPNRMTALVAFYLGDKVLFGGLLKNQSTFPKLPNLSDRQYLFIENVESGATPPDWLVYFGNSPNVDDFQMAGGSMYRRVAVMDSYFERTSFHRPEPNMHISFPYRGKKLRNVFIYRRIKDAQ